MNNTSIAVWATARSTRTATPCPNGAKVARVRVFGAFIQLIYLSDIGCTRLFFCIKLMFPTFMSGGSANEWGSGAAGPSESRASPHRHQVK